MALQPKSWQQVLQELWELLRAYAAQETFGPLANLKRQVAYGLVGSIIFSLGIFLVALAAMRFLQTHWTWSAQHSWLAYLVGVVILTVTIAVCAMKIRVKPSASARSAAMASVTGSDLDLTSIENGSTR